MSTPKRIESNRANSKKSSGPGKAEQFRTFGEILPGLCFEVVIGPQKPQSLQLHASNGTRFWTSSRIEHREQIYMPAAIDDGLAAAVRFPSASTEFGSPEKLTGSMAKYFCDFGKATPEDANLLAAFALATWFADLFRLAPCLHLTGASTRVRPIMRLLACLCRRPLLLGRLDLSVLSTLPKGLNPTLLIYEEKLAKNVARILETSRNRDLAIPYGKSWIHSYGARVLFSDPNGVNASDLRVHFVPTAGAFPELKDDAERTIAADFQAKLLRYRMLHFNTVRDSNFEFAEVDPAMQDDARSLLTPLIDCGDLRASILSSLLSRSKEVSGARFTELDCLVIEAALCFCHDSSKSEFFVKDVTDAVNAILMGRHEELVISSKTVGTALRGLGLFAERVTKGYRVSLTDGNRERIHRLAGDYNVASIQEGARCDQCGRTDATPS
jgi:hypothetical protein